LKDKNNINMYFIEYNSRDNSFIDISLWNQSTGSKTKSVDELDDDEKPKELIDVLTGNKYYLMYDNNNNVLDIGPINEESQQDMKNPSTSQDETTTKSKTDESKNTKAIDEAQSKNKQKIPSKKICYLTQHQKNLPLIQHQKKHQHLIPHQKQKKQNRKNYFPRLVHHQKQKKNKLKALLH
jgi:hypothetical protein